MHGLDVVAIDFPLQHFALRIVEIPLLDEPVTLDHNELLELGVVPVLALGDAGLGDVDAYLTGVEGVHQLGKGAAVVHVHLEREGGLLVRQVAEIGAVELLSKAAGRDFWDHQGLGLFSEALQKFHNLAKGHMMRYRAIAIATLRSLGFARDDGEAVELAMVLVTLESGKHLVHQVIDIEQLQLYAGVVDGIRQIVGKGVAEGGHGTVVVGAAPLTKQIWEAVNEHPRSGLLTILQEEVFTCLLAAAVLAVAKAAGEGGLLAAGEHHGTGVVVLLKRVQQGTGKAKVALHELFLALGAVHSGQIEDEISICAPCIQLLEGVSQIVFVNIFDDQVRESPVFSIFDILKRPAEVFTYKTFCASNKNLHYFTMLGIPFSSF